MGRTKLNYNIHQELAAGSGPFTIPESAQCISIKAADVGDWSVEIEGSTITYLGSDPVFTPSFNPPVLPPGYQPEMIVNPIGTKLYVVAIY